MPHIYEDPLLRDPLLRDPLLRRKPMEGTEGAYSATDGNELSATTQNPAEVVVMARRIPPEEYFPSAYADLKRQRADADADRKAFLQERADFEKEMNKRYDELSEAIKLADLSTDNPTIADEAKALVYGDRQAAYGHPASDFTATGRINGAILQRWLGSEGYVLSKRDEVSGKVIPGAQEKAFWFPDIPPRVVALMMQGVKLSREASKPGVDNRRDGVGYWLCTDRIVNGETE